MKRSILVVNFGGPRSLEEIEPFLVALLTDPDVIRTKMPRFIEKLFFTRVAKKRTPKARAEYLKIGGKSPIFDDTEVIAKAVSSALSLPVLTFHRYLPETHPTFFSVIEGSDAEEILVFPLFPQFSYTTTGSIARFFSHHLSERVVQKMRWIKSYSAHPAYIAAMTQCLCEFLTEKKIEEEECALLFSAHGLPRNFVDQGDIYESECNRSFQALAKAFPQALSHLSYQSKFGRGEWLRPYTDETVQNLASWSGRRKHVVIVPLSFTSDHIETLFEIEEQYLPPIRAAGFSAYRCPALNLRPDWLSAIPHILSTTSFSTTEMLIRR
jgi:ferrochelatase